MNMDNEYIMKFIAEKMDMSWRYGLVTGIIIGLVPMIITLMVMLN